MKKFLAISFVSALVLGCVSTQALTTSSDVEKGYISVSTTANTEIAPDIAEISIAVQTFDNKSMQKATLQNKEISEKVITELKSMINTANGDFIKTSNYSASPVYSYSGNKKTFDKYQVSNSVIVHTKSIDKVGAMIDKSIALGATNVNSLSFSVSSYENECNNLLELASKRAKSRAEAVAKVVPAQIAGIRTMDISCSTNNTVKPQYRLMKANLASETLSASAETSPTTIESGVVKINANVNASYFVK
jgi:hypothetical protein